MQKAFDARSNSCHVDQKSKQTNMHTCVSVYVYVHTEREQTVSHSSPPQLKGVREISVSVCARACVLVLFCYNTQIHVK